MRGVPGSRAAADDPVMGEPRGPELDQAIEDFLTWEATEEHRELAKPLRDCIDKATSLKYVVVEETRGGQES
jgi:hypothetical protein